MLQIYFPFLSLNDEDFLSTCTELDKNQINSNIKNIENKLKEANFFSEINNPDDRDCDFDKFDQDKNFSFEDNCEYVYNTNSYISKESDISIINFNIKAHYKKITDLISSSNTDFDVITFTETWMDDDSCLEDYTIIGYHPPIAQNRRDGSGGGGVVIYLRETFESYNIIQKLSHTDIHNNILTVKALKNKKSHYIYIPAILLKKCCETISDPILLIWEQSLTTGDIPHIYKEQLITPIHKKGSKGRPENYRPVSLMSHIIKTVERVLRKKIVNYLDRNNILCSNQHGFRKGRSCLTQLLHHVDDILNNFTNNHDTDAIYLDYAKAFDKVDHKLLVKKLQLYGIHGKLLNWIKAFLTNRHQRVVVNGKHSYIAEVISGVPQGTVLGPLLFLIFVNDMQSCVKDSMLRSFADDTRIMRAITTSDDINLLQQDLDRVITWASDNNMLLHQDKFEVLNHSVGTNTFLQELPFINQLYCYETTTGTLQPQSSVKDLGILISADLSWTPHISSIVKKAISMSAWVFSVFKNRSVQTMLTLYKTMVRSHLEYCCPVWNPSNIADIKLLESVQRSFTARIHGFQHLDYWQRLKALNLMSLQRRRERYLIVHMWKVLYAVCPNNLNITFKYSDRKGIQALLPNLKKDSQARFQSAYDKSFAVMGPKLWNTLPKNITLIDGFGAFKTSLTTYVLKIPDTPPVSGLVPQNDNSLLQWYNDASRKMSGGYVM